MKIENGVLINVCDEDIKNGTLVVPSGVKKIDKEVFEYNHAESVILPKTLKEISQYAFARMPYLKEITIPKGVKKIESNAFWSCENLKTVVIGGAEVIEFESFFDCPELENVIFSNNLKEIKMFAFNGCRSLKEINLPRSLETIGSFAFRSCYALTSIDIPEGIKKIDTGSFSACFNLRSAKLPKGLKKIGDACFYNCKKLNHIDLPDDLESLENEIFKNCCELEKVELPKSIKIIGFEIFSGTKISKIELPENVVRIGASAFKNCEHLKSITIPKKVKNIEYGAFDGCINLKEVLLESESGIHIVTATDENLEMIYNKIDFVREFVEERDRLNKKFLPAPQVILNTPKSFVENFYKHSKDWGIVLDEFAKSMHKTAKEIAYEPKADFYKLCFISGLFSDNSKEREAAKKFIETKIIGKFGENDFHSQFSGLETRKNGYVPEYAEFLIKNFTEGFMTLELDEDTFVNYFADSYNRFAEIRSAYPNSVVSTNTQNDMLTPKDVIAFLTDIRYQGVSTQLEQDLADYCARYGYSQLSFDLLKSWLNIGIKIKEEGRENLFCKEDYVTDKNKVTYKFLEKGDPLGAVLGNITNCCQRADDAGETCCRHGMTDPNGGFVVFKKGDRIVGQSWVWFDEPSQKICLDNVEVPRSAKIMISGKQAGFIDCLKRLKSGFISAMQEHGKKASFVTMGEGYNDILDIAKDQFKQVSATDVIAVAAISSAANQIKLAGHSPFGVYTDTKAGERIIE